MAKQKMFSDIKDANGVPVSSSSDGLAAWAGVSPRTARNKCAEPGFPAVKIGRAWRVNLPEALKVLGLYPSQTTTAQTEATE